MASCITDQWGGSSTAPQIKLTLTEVTGGSTGGTVKWSWSLDYIAHGYAVSGAIGTRIYTVTIDGQEFTGTVAASKINGKTGTSNLATGVVVVNRTHSNRSMSFSLSFEMQITWSGSYKGTVTASGSATVNRKTSYTISYDANGGSGAPSSQTKWYEENLTLRTGTPSRTGYSFSKWTTSSNGSGVSYKPGDTCTRNENLTLYAQWTANTYKVSYNANGGSGAPSSQTKTYGVNLKLSSDVPTKANYTFKGWGTSSSSTIKSYDPGSTYSSNSAITLYAIWELAYVKPRISNVSVYRCNNAGVKNESGTYYKAEFKWNTDLAVSSIKVGYKSLSDSNYTESSISGSGTSGTVVSSILGSGRLDSELMYDVRIVVSDSRGSTDVSMMLPAISFIMDIKEGGKGISIGKPAVTDDLFEVQWATQFNNGIKFDWINRKQINQNEDLNSYGNSGHYYCSANQTVRTLLNCPTTIAFILDVFSGTGKEPLTGFSAYEYATQILTDYYGNKFFRRRETGSPVTQNWNPWVQMISNGKGCYNSGDSISIKKFTCGFTYSAGKEVHFSVSLPRPVSSNVSAVSVSGRGLIVRHETYKYGSSLNNPIQPDSWSGEISEDGCSINIAAIYSNASSEVIPKNLISVGVEAYVTLTFS